MKKYSDIEYIPTNLAPFLKETLASSSFQNLEAYFSQNGNKEPLSLEEWIHQAIPAFLHDNVELPEAKALLIALLRINNPNMYLVEFQREKEGPNQNLVFLENPDDAEWLSQIPKDADNFLILFIENVSKKIRVQFPQYTLSGFSDILCEFFAEKLLGEACDLQTNILEKIFDSVPQEVISRIVDLVEAEWNDLFSLSVEQRVELGLKVQMQVEKKEKYQELVYRRFFKKMNEISEVLSIGKLLHETAEKILRVRRSHEGDLNGCQEKVRKIVLNFLDLIEKSLESDDDSFCNRKPVESFSISIHGKLLSALSGKKQEEDFE